MDTLLEAMMQARHGRSLWKLDYDVSMADSSRREIWLPVLSSYMIYYKSPDKHGCILAIYLLIDCNDAFGLVINKRWLRADNSHGYPCVLLKRDQFFSDIHSDVSGQVDTD